MADSTGVIPSTEPEPPRYADESAEELEDAAALDRRPSSRLPADRFIDREESWLAFNERVLELATDSDVPLLERVRFMAIFARNLDEFFMVRVAALRRRVEAGVSTLSSTGRTPRERLATVSAMAQSLADRHAAHFRDTMRDELFAAGVQIVRWRALSEEESATVGKLFQERISPVLTPLAVDPAHPFPYISGLSLNLAVVVREGDTGAEHFARVKVPPLLPRFLATDDVQRRFVPIEEVIAAHLPQLFPGLQVLEASSFRVTRNEDLEVDSDVDNLLQALERELSRRRFGVPVRLEVEADVSDHVLELLVRELDIGNEAVYRVPAPLDLAGLWSLSDLDIIELRYPPVLPETHPALRPSEGKVDVFAALRHQDVLVHHPYDSFTTSVQAMIEQAARDPDVHAIKLTLYRTSGESSIVDALVDAAHDGKQVLVVVEIKARFDEQANIRWAHELEQAGCHVVYGLVGLKTHCKLALVVRSDPDGTLRRYVHVGTGNYNPKTARVYEDLGLLTADEEVGADVADLFNHLSGYTRHRDYSSLLVAPDFLRSRLLAMIAGEAEHARAGRPSGISLKVNNLVDIEIIDALYDASSAGVPMDLVVRGMCALRPGQPGLSESIRVRSILGRFLEHSRIYRFNNGGDPQTWIGSADVMDRNLDRRVEALVRVRDEEGVRLLDLLLELSWADGVDCWTLDGKGEWQRTAPAQRLIDYQSELAARRRPFDAADAGRGE